MVIQYKIIYLVFGLLALILISLVFVGFSLISGPPERRHLGLRFIWTCGGILLAMGTGLIVFISRNP